MNETYTPVDIADLHIGMRVRIRCFRPGTELWITHGDHRIVALHGCYFEITPWDDKRTQLGDPCIEFKNLISIEEIGATSARRAARG